MRLDGYHKNLEEYIMKCFLEIYVDCWNNRIGKENI